MRSRSVVGACIAVAIGLTLSMLGATPASASAAGCTDYNGPNFIDRLCIEVYGADAYVEKARVSRSAMNWAASQPAPASICEYQAKVTGHTYGGPYSAESVYRPECSYQPYFTFSPTGYYFKDGTKFCGHWREDNGEYKPQLACVNIIEKSHMIAPGGEPIEIG